MCGKKVSRRKFLKYLTYGTCGAAAHTSLLPGLTANALAAPTQRASVDNALLYVINLAGGASYNTLPIYSTAWRDKHKTTSYGAEESFPMTNEQGIHPSLAYFKELYLENDLAIINEIGFPNDLFSRSHQIAAYMWMKATGTPLEASKNGWMNSLACQMNGPFAAISLAGADPITHGGCEGMRAIESLSKMVPYPPLLWSSNETEWLNSRRTQFREASTTPENASKSVIHGATASIEPDIPDLVQTYSTVPPAIGIEPPEGAFGSDLVDAVKLTMNSQNLGTKAFSLELGGFDTHTDEREKLGNVLKDLNDGVKYLAENNKALGLWNRTIILIISEFSRTFENSDQGTDHGHSGFAMLTGGGINGGLITPPPTKHKIEGTTGAYLTSPAVDTRNFIRQVIEGMGYSADPIILDTGYDMTDLGLFL